MEEGTRSTDADTGLSGRVVASHGRRVVVEDVRGVHHACTLFGRRLEPVCGDQVLWQARDAEGAAGIVVAVLPRRTELARTTSRGQREVIAANLTQLVAVIAPRPEPDLALCDRYLAAAAWAGLRAAIVFNKVDLADAGHDALRADLATYRTIGYPVVDASTRTATGTDQLLALLRGEASALVGQSGVGKSSLINRLVPGVEAMVREVSRATDEGRHTTTASTLYHLPGGGDLVDSPGVRDFAPPLPPPRDVASGYVEIAAAGRQCRFPDCLHAGEPGCTVAAAVEAGRIEVRRLQSYRRLLELARGFDERRRTEGRPRDPRGGPGPRLRK